MTITLYDCPTAPSPRRARIFLAEKGISHATVNIDLSKGEQLGAAFRAINPMCTVPALRLEDGQLLTDNAAISAYLEARFPEPPLLGRSPMDKAQVASWNWRSEFEGLLAVAEALRNSSPAMAGRALPGPVNYPQIPELAQRGLDRLQHYFDELDAQLEDNETVAGCGFSVADITAVVAVDFARVVRVKPCDTHANIRRWRSAMALRPAMGL
jgi:glutathione S-transferase